MKICLYLEYLNLFGGFMYKHVGTGLLSSYKNQKKILTNLGIDYVEKWDSTCDILQINTPWLKSIYLMKKARRQGKKVVVWSHVTAEDAAQVFRFNRLFEPLIKGYLTYAYNLADLIFAPSEYTKSLLVAYGLPEAKIVAMSNGVNIENYRADIDKRIAGRKKYRLNKLAIGTVGLAIPRKGIDTFFALAARFPDYPFMWYGKIYNKFLTKPLPKNRPTNIKFTGYVGDILEAFNSLDIFIFPSYEENEGMVILEAASLGLPILVRDIPVYRGWLVDGDNCLKAKSTDGFADCLERLIKDEKLRHKLGDRARKLAESRSIETMAAKTKTIYENLLGD